MGIDKDWVLREVQSGRTMTDVARECAVSVGYVSRICSSQGFNLRPRLADWEPDRQAREASIVEARDVYGLSFRQIGEGLGITGNRAGQIYAKAKERQEADD